MNTAFQAMYNLLQSDPRYKFEAYQFVRESLAYAHEHLPLEPTPPSPSGAQPKSVKSPIISAGKASKGGPDAAAPQAVPASTGQHITGQQLCEACRQYGLQQYGYLAHMVLNNWGVRSTSDFGEIVYNLIRIEQMRKSDSDRREDFDDVYSFDTAFQPQFDMMAPENAT
jgi:uncharacterized repeat protein (TIGR04138 family)